MKCENKKGKTLETIEIFENAIVIFNDGAKELFDAIQIIDKEVIVGRILNHKLFVKCGGISKDNIKSIEGVTKRTVFKKS